ncbi:MAG: adenosylcobinamide-GDP ribazoletransferase, partial [Cyanobacteriota bacterium]
MPSWWPDLAGSWIFYTVLPPLPGPPPQFGRIARFAPLV